jgi:thiosulfate/3-mercaptopyruvate sulfurtransferase
MNTVILDARPRAAYEAGHVEGAIHADLETQLSAKGDPAKGGRHPLPPIERWLAQVEEWGITPSTRVIVYDDADGANAAARAWWMLRATGHGNVEVLSRSAVAASHRSGSELPKRRLAVAALLNWQLPTVTIDKVDRLRTDPEWRVLDVRSRERFRGETEPIDPVAGHIPGAINLPYTENIGKTPQQLREMYEELLQGVPPGHLVVHCGSGVTACQTLLALDRAGLHGASLYVGSWSEWCRSRL